MLRNGCYRMRTKSISEKQTIRTMQFCDNGVRRYCIWLGEDLLHNLPENTYHASSVVGLWVVAYARKLNEG